MPNGNLKHEVECPICKEKRLVRSDVLKKLINEQKPTICKPCHNRIRFAEKDHPRKGTGIKNNKDLKRTYSSYFKAKRRCKMGKLHHACYENVEFRFESFQQFLDCVGVRPENMTIDRIDPLGHYETGNIRWATIRQQTDNRLPRGYWQKLVKW